MLRKVNLKLNYEMKFNKLNKMNLEKEFDSKKGKWSELMKWVKWTRIWFEMDMYLSGVVIINISRVI